MVKYFKWGEQMYEYTLIRSSRRTLAVQITEDGEIVVRAPRLYSRHKIDKFIEEHAGWIEKSLAEQQKRKDGKAELSDGDIKKLKKLAGEILPKKTEYYAGIMGVTYSGVKITSAQKRFGSCSGKNGICYSYMLMLYPEEAIDYVVVHELAHTVHHNHSAKFYSLVADILPDYKSREKLLKGSQKLPWS